MLFSTKSFFFQTTRGSENCDHLQRSSAVS